MMPWLSKSAHGRKSSVASRLKNESFHVGSFFWKYLGGGWTLVVSISSENNDHLQTNANNCLNSILCVPFNDNDITGRKLSDEDIHKLSQTEGRVTLITLQDAEKYIKQQSYRQKSYFL